MADLGNLVVSLEANIAKFQSDMGKAAHVAQTTAEGINNAMERAKRAMETAFAGLSIAGIAELGLHAIEMGDQLQKAATKAGIAGKSMASLSYAAKLADIDLDSLSTGLKKMQVALSEAESGGKTQNDTLAALGLTFKQLKSLSPDRQFEVLGQKISELKDPADRARAATELFGKAGANLLPMFEDGAEGIRKAREEAERMGLAFSDEQIRKLSEADDAIKSLKASFQGLATTLTLEAVPGITAFVDEVAGLISGDKIKQLRTNIADVKDAIKDGRGIFAVGMEGFPYSGYFSHDKLPAILTQMEEKLRAANVKPEGPDTSKVGTQAIGYAAQKAAEDRAKWAQDAAKAEIDSYVDGQKKFDEIQKAESAYASAASRLRTYTVHQEVEDQIKDWGRYFDIHKNVDDMIAEWDRWIAEVDKKNDAIAGFADQAARNMQTAFANFLFDPFKGGLRGMLSGFVDVVRRMVAEAAAAKLLKSLFGENGSGSGGGLSGFFGSLLGSVFGGGKASGGPLETGKWYIAGEHGPEPIWGGGAGAFAMGYGGSGGSSMPTINLSIDARGSTQDAVKMLPAIAQQIIGQAVQASRAAFRDDLSRGALRGAR